MLSFFRGLYFDFMNDNIRNTLFYIQLLIRLMSSTPFTMCKYVIIVLFAFISPLIFIGCSSEAVNDIDSSLTVTPEKKEINDNGDYSWGDILVPNDYASIQKAIDAAKTGEIIVVQTGVYRENLNFKGKDIILSSTDPDNPETVAQTVIDGNNNGPSVSFISGESANSVLRGFTITGGSGKQQEYKIESYDGSELLFNRNYGGGILITNSSPTITNNVIKENQVKNISDDIVGIGGGIAVLDNSSPHVTGNYIINNYAEGYGGGVAVWYHSEPVINNNFINDNSAGDYGGGIMITMLCSPEIKENFIEHNTAIWGGGIYIAHMSEAEIISNRINFNQAELGAGIFARKTEGVLLADNILSGNVASRNGGAVFLDNQATLAIHYNFIENNQAASAGGGLWVDNDSRAYLIWLDKDSLPHHAWPDDNNDQGNSPDNINLRKTDFMQAYTPDIPLKFKAIEEYLMSVFPESHRRTWLPEFNNIDELSNQDKLFIVFFSKYISYNDDDTISASAAEKAAISVFGFNAIEHEHVGPYYIWNEEDRNYRWEWPAGTAGSSKIKIIKITETADSYLVDAVPLFTDYDLYNYKGDYIYDDKENMVTHIVGIDEMTELSYLPFMPVRRYVLAKKSDGSYYVSQSYKMP